MKIFTKTRYNAFEFESAANGDDDLLAAGKKLNLVFSKMAGNRYLLIKDNRTFNITVSKDDEGYNIQVNGSPFHVMVEDEHSRTIKELIKSRGTSAGEKSIKAPIPGLIVNVLIKKTDTVRTGQALLILEAMKMENVIKAPFDCEVIEVLVKAGNTVNQNQLLLKLRAL